MVVLTQTTRSDFCTVSMSVRQVTQHDRRHPSFRSWRNNEVCHVNLYVNMLHVKACTETLLALFLPNLNLAGGKKTPQSKAIKSRAMLIPSNNPLEFTHAEVSNHYLTFRN